MISYNLLIYLFGF